MLPSLDVMLIIIEQADSASKRWKAAHMQATEVTLILNITV